MKALVELLDRPGRREAAVRHFGWHSTPSIESAMRSAKDTSAVSATERLELHRHTVARASAAGPGAPTTDNFLNRDFGALHRLKHGCVVPSAMIERPHFFLLQPAAHPHGGLTPAETPLSDAENLFREPGPLQAKRAMIGLLVAGEDLL
jgi:hypothetical protein